MKCNSPIDNFIPRLPLLKWRFWVLRCPRKVRIVWIIGAAGEAVENYTELDVSGPVALVMGSEGDGMRRLTREHCDQLVKIPMRGSVSSLNVSVACGILLFELTRQR